MDKQTNGLGLGVKYRWSDTLLTVTWENGSNPIFKLKKLEKMFKLSFMSHFG